MSVLRDIVNVHSQIYAIIPKENEEFREELEEFINSTWNLAPEVRSGPEVYIPYTNILYKYIPNPNCDWQIKVRDIFNGV